jgi:hypothetical protein
MIVTRNVIAMNRTRKNVHQIQVAVIRWEVDSNEESIPESVADLVAKGYLSGLPINPFTGKTVEIVAIDGETSPGDISYLPVFTAGPEYDEYPCGFAVLGYGPVWYSNEYYKRLGFPAHVIIALDGGTSLGGLDTNGNGIADTKGCRSGLLCEDVIRVHRGENIRGWRMLAQYRESGVIKGEAKTAP